MSKYKSIADLRKACKRESERKPVMFGAPERSLGCWSEEKEVVGCVEACK